MSDNDEPIIFHRYEMTDVGCEIVSLREERDELRIHLQEALGIIDDLTWFGDISDKLHPEDGEILRNMCARAEKFVKRHSGR